MFVWGSLTCVIVPRNMYIVGFGLFALWLINDRIAGVNTVKLEILRSMLPHSAAIGDMTAAEHWIKRERYIMMNLNDQVSYITSLLHDVRCIDRDHMQAMLDNDRSLTVYGDMGIKTDIWESIVFDAQTSGEELPVTYDENNVCLKERNFTLLLQEQISRLRNWRKGFIGPVIAAVTTE